jgi:hypothetical protein
VGNRQQHRRAANLIAIDQALESYMMARRRMESRIRMTLGADGGGTVRGAAVTGRLRSRATLS